MVRLRQLFVIAGMAFSFFGNDIAPASAQTDNPKAAAKKLNQQREVLKLLRSRMPPIQNAKRWVDAFLGEERRDKSGKVSIVKRPQYIGALFSDYFKSNETIKLKTVAWVERVARGLIVSGDGDMFMLLASHYVRHETNASMYSHFNNSRTSFDRNIENLGQLLSRTLSQMPPNDQRKFKENFARAIAGTFVNNCDDSSPPECIPHPDLPLAIMGYRLFKDFAQGSGVGAKAATDAAIQAMHKQFGKYTLKEDDVLGLLSSDGVEDFKTATSSYVSQSQSPLIMLMEMGVRVDWKVGEAIRRQFMTELQPNGNPALGLSFYAQTYNMADQHTRARLNGTLAQQMTAREWQRALGFTMNMAQVRGLYEANYLSPDQSTKHLFAAALHKSYTPQEAAEMSTLFADIIKKSAGNPEAYYRLMDDFKNHDAYQQALAAKEKLTIPQAAAHFDFLAAIYVYATDFNQTLDSNLRLMSLIREHPIAEKNKAQMQVAFRQSITKYAALIGSQGDPAYQLAKLVQTANNAGWDGLMDDAFIRVLQSKLSGATHSQAASTLNSVLEVRARRDADARRLKGLRPSIFDDARPK